MAVGWYRSPLGILLQRLLHQQGELVSPPERLAAARSEPIPVRHPQSPRLKNQGENKWRARAIRKVCEKRTLTTLTNFRC